MFLDPPFRRFRRLRSRPRRTEPPDLFHASRWERLPDVLLSVAILKLGTKEQLASGPARVRYRARRLRAVAVYRHRFDRVPPSAVGRELHW